MCIITATLPNPLSPLNNKGGQRRLLVSRLAPLGDTVQFLHGETRPRNLK